MLTRLIAFLCLCTSTLAIAQARPTATKAGELQIGGGIISANSDYDGRFKGFFGYADFDITRHLGGEFEIHQIYSSDGQQIHERTYEVGARYRLHYGPIQPYAKVMIGRGVFNFPYNLANLGYNIAAIGGGADYHLLRHVNLRGEFEYQHWSSFQANALTPALISFGAAYHF